MTITATTLTRAAAVAAAAAGALFIGVQIGHPHLDVTTVTTTEVIVRNTVKLVMAAFALAGVTGLYASQVRRNGVLGLVGYLLLSAGYLLIMCTTFAAAFVLPAVAATDPTYVGRVLDAASDRPMNGDVGALATIFQVQGAAWLAGGLLFGIALFRAGVLARWATCLLAFGGVVTALLSVMPDAFYRLLAFPNGIAMIALGWSLWRTAQTAPWAPLPQPTAPPRPRPTSRPAREVAVEGREGRGRLLEVRQVSGVGDESVATVAQCFCVGAGRRPRPRAGGRSRWCPTDGSARSPCPGGSDDGGG